MTTYLPVGSSPDVEADRVGADGWPQTTKPPAVPCEVQAYKVVHSYRFPNPQQANKVLKVYADGVLTRAENKQAARHRVGMDVVAVPVRDCPQPELSYRAYVPLGGHADWRRDEIADDGWPMTLADPPYGPTTQFATKYWADFVYRPTNRQATAAIVAAYADGVLTREEADAIRPWLVETTVNLDIPWIEYRPTYTTYLPLGSTPDARYEEFRDGWPQTIDPPRIPCGVQAYRADWAFFAASVHRLLYISTPFADGLLTRQEYGEADGWALNRHFHTVDIVALPVTPCS